MIKYMIFFSKFSFVAPNKYNRSLKFSNAFYEFHKHPSINELSKKYAILDLWGIFFHRFGKAVNAEP